MFLSFQNTLIVCLEIPGLRWARFLFDFIDLTFTLMFTFRTVITLVCFSLFRPQLVLHWRCK